MFGLLVKTSSSSLPRWVLRSEEETRRHGTARRLVDRTGCVKTLVRSLIEGLWARANRGLFKLWSQVCLLGGYSKSMQISTSEEFYKELVSKNLVLNYFRHLSAEHLNHVCKSKCPAGCLARAPKRPRSSNTCAVRRSRTSTSNKKTEENEDGTPKRKESPSF